VMLGKTLLDPNNKFWANDSTRFGYQMLLKMGWKPTKGLGKCEQGATRHVAVAMKDDRAGVGSNTPEDSVISGWLQSSKEYHSTLAALPKIIVNCNDKQDLQTDITQTTKEKTTEFEPKQEQETRPAEKTHKHFIPTRTIRGKNVSHYSKTDLSAIFGGLSPEEPASTSSTPTTQDPLVPETKEFKNSDSHIYEYFDQKKKEKTSPNSDKSTRQSKKDKKRKCRDEAGTKDRISKKRKTETPVQESTKA